MEFKTCYEHDKNIHIDESENCFRGCFSKQFNDYNIQYFNKANAKIYDDDKYNYYEFEKNNTTAINIFDALLGFKEIEKTLPFYFTIKQNIENIYPKKIFDNEYISIFDYTAKSIAFLIKNDKFIEMVIKKYNCNIETFFEEQKNLRDLNERGYCVPKFKIDYNISYVKTSIKKMILELAGVDITEKYQVISNKSSDKINIGKMGTFNEILEKPVTFKGTSITDIYIELLNLKLPENEVEEKSFCGKDGLNRIILYGNVNLVDEKFNKLDMESILKDTEFIKEDYTQNPDKRIKIITYIISE